MSEGYDSFENLHIWQNVMEICTEVCSLFSNSKNFVLRDQIERSAISIPSNIAEGFERQSNKEFIRYLFIAKASCGELRTQLLIAIKISAIDKQRGLLLIQQARMVSGMIQNLIKARRNSTLR